MNLFNTCRAALTALAFTSSCISHAEVVVVVGSRHPVSTLTKAQVTDLFLGRAKEFPNGSPALTAIIAAGPSKDEFFERILSKTDSQARSIWARLVFTGIGTGPREINDATQMKRLLAANPNAIGFIDRSEVDHQVKVVYSP